MTWMLKVRPAETVRGRVLVHTVTWAQVMPGPYYYLFIFNYIDCIP